VADVEPTEARVDNSLWTCRLPPTTRQGDGRAGGIESVRIALHHAGSVSKRSRRVLVCTSTYDSMPTAFSGCGAP